MTFSFEVPGAVFGALKRRQPLDGEMLDLVVASGASAKGWRARGSVKCTLTAAAATKLAMALRQVGECEYSHGSASTSEACIATSRSLDDIVTGMLLSHQLNQATSFASIASPVPRRWRAPEYLSARVVELRAATDPLVDELRRELAGDSIPSRALLVGWTGDVHPSAVAVSDRELWWVNLGTVERWWPMRSVDVLYAVDPNRLDMENRGEPEILLQCPYCRDFDEEDESEADLGAVGELWQDLPELARASLGPDLVIYRHHDWRRRPDRPFGLVTARENRDLDEFLPPAGTIAPQPPPTG